MNHRRISTACAALVAVATLAGCTMKKTEAPDLAGPSEASTSVVVNISPDVLQQDGASQSVVTVTARDANGQPARNLSMRVEIRIGGTIADFGSLSARSIVTGSDGKASLVYTAPPSTSPAVDPFTVVDIAVIPIGNDFGNSTTRMASVRLVPPGVVIPQDGLRPAFTFTPSAPQDHQTVLFDGSTSTAAAGNSIASYSWNFGDGDTGSGRTATHAYDSPGTYIASLTIADAFGRSATISQSITVGAGAIPTAAFVFSPSDPIPGTTVFFNASASRAAPGRSIVSYEWDFGDGTFGTGVTASRRYPILGSYTVTLVVTDDAGRRGIASQTVPVALPDEEAATAPALKKGGTLRD